MNDATKDYRTFNEAQEEISLAQDFIRSSLAVVRFELDLAYNNFKTENISDVDVIRTFQRLRNAFEDLMADHHYLDTLKRLT